MKDRMCEIPKWVIFAILIVIFIIIIIFCCVCHSSYPKIKVETIEVQLEDIPEAQKEMEIMVNYVVNNSRQIVWIREILIGIIIGITSLILKEYYLSRNGDSKIIINRHIFLICSILFVAVIFALIIELGFQAQQAFLVNRVWQLDNAINNKIISPCPNKLQQVFAPKDTVLPVGSNCSVICTVAKAKSFWTFYVPIIIFILIFPCFLKRDPPSSPCQTRFE